MTETKTKRATRGAATNQAKRRFAVQRLASLRIIAEWHEEQAAFWKMTRRQSWGRAKSLKDGQRKMEVLHAKFANTIRQQVSEKLNDAGGKP